MTQGPLDSTANTLGMPAAAQPPPPGTRPGDHLSGERFAPGVVVAERYRIVALLGRGGMGEVYRAEDLKLGQTVALKFLPRETVADRDALERLYGEVRVGRQVAHPNVCRIYDVVEAEGQAFLAMEYIDGEDLASLLRRIGRLPPVKAAEIARDLCSGLAAVHDLGLVHRDLKPANVMVDGRGRARLMDLGLAESAAVLLQERELAGTILYMAPEQLRAGEASARSDVYSVGLVIREMLSGQRPPEADSFDELRTLRESSEPPREEDFPIDADPNLVRLVRRCLEPVPSSRPGTARELMTFFPNRLEAAIAAGQTPSPADIAVGGREGELSAAGAWTFLVVFFVALAVLLLATDRTTLYRRIELSLSPAVLTDRAAAVLAAAGLNDQPGDQAHGFFNVALAPIIAHTGGFRADVRPSPSRFYYRRSPRLLGPKDARIVGLWLVGYSRLGLVTRTDPPETLPGMASVVLDPGGGLLKLTVVPPQRAERDSANGSQDPMPFLEATGIDPQTLQPTRPVWTPPVASDERQAWIVPDGRRIETAWWLGQMVWLRVFGPWEESDDRPRPPPLVAFQRIVFVITIVFFLVGAIWLVRRQLCAGLGDRRGALRLSFFVTAILVAAGLFRIDHLANPLQEFFLLATLLSHVSISALATFALYVAVEPWARRRRPWALVGWARILTGRWRDPLVGRDVLVGLAAGIAASALATGGAALDTFFVPASFVPSAQAWTPFDDARHVLYFLIYLLFPALLNAIGLMLSWILLRAFLRYELLTNLIFLALVAFPFVTNGPALLTFRALGGFAAAVVFAGVFWRHGLLALSTALYVIFVAGYLPFVIDTSAWYGGRGLAVVLLLSALAVASFLVSLGGRPVLGREIDI